MSLRGQAENPCLPDHEAGKVDSLFCYRTGQAVFDVDDAMAREIYADNPVLPRFYKSYADLVYFRLSAATLDYYDLTPGKATARTAADWIDSISPTSRPLPNFSREKQVRLPASTASDRAPVLPLRKIRRFYEK